MKGVTYRRVWRDAEGCLQVEEVRPMRILRDELVGWWRALPWMPLRVRRWGWALRSHMVFGRRHWVVVSTIAPVDSSDACRIVRAPVLNSPAVALAFRRHSTHRPADRAWLDRIYRQEGV